MSTLDAKTRGRTAPGRLRALDAYLCRFEPRLLSRVDGAWARAVFVDVGFGEHPWTTLESAEAFRVLQPELTVIGVELEEARALAAQVHAGPRTHFRQGGFELPLSADEPARLVRAMNLLRQGPAERVSDVHHALGRFLLPSGLLVEGSSDPEGSVLTAHLLRRASADGDAPPMREALLFHTDFRNGFAPLLFRDWLPRDLRRRVRPGEPMHTFFQAWMEAWRQAREAGHTSPPDAFRESVTRLGTRLGGVAMDAWLLDSGYLVWRPEGGVSP
ncbi:MULTISPECIES: methylase [Myxococcus]|uniref:Methylase n=1 Tax=Myxococcus llanfairpwllgwyngyllgogerychwyrndrobwllllantysiliogogogochensis TaxID=2590453 RepID=A0A540WMX2_9BACT|nr:MULTISPECIES: methylase [Myxococcus]NTX04419.1 methylase [Myxococcus sp. CA040A]TQF10345.1 methylase [Myxococcus llanfairpwllgwyngyllgogerychwyrndrobwllllantysiliogogogochensis]